MDADWIKKINRHQENIKKNTKNHNKFTIVWWETLAAIEHKVAPAVKIILPNSGALLHNKSPLI